MTQEIEKLKAELVAAQCRIDELELQICDIEIKTIQLMEFSEGSDYDKGFHRAAFLINRKIKHITGK